MTEKLEKMHLGKDIISALRQLEGVRIIDDRGGSIQYADHHFYSEHNIQIELILRKVVYDRYDGFAWRLERLLSNAGIHYPRWLRNKIGYVVTTGQLTLDKLSELLSRYPAIDSPEATTETSLHFKSEIHGINPLTERVHIYLKAT